MSSDWQRPPPELTLAGDEAHVWRLDLGDSPALRESIEILDAAERARAGRFRFEKDRRQYTLARAVLRRLAGYYLGIPARRIEFSYTARNKPYIAEAQNPVDLRFNVSHSGGWALLAFCRGRQVGVDLESSERLADRGALAARIFSPREQAELESLPAAQRPPAFFNGWTRKEAWLKATGDGLIDELRGIEVTLSPDLPARLLAIHGDEAATRKWSLHALRPAEAFAGALVVEGTGVSVRLWEWRRGCFRDEPRNAER